jgi:hypothetical protein
MKLFSRRTPMVDMKTAVKAAITFIEDFFPGAKDIRLEEVGPDGALWSVTVSFKTGDSEILSDVMKRDARIYKIVVIEADTGEPRAMRNWGE